MTPNSEKKRSLNINLILGLIVILLVVSSMGTIGTASMPKRKTSSPSGTTQTRTQSVQNKCGKAGGGIDQTSIDQNNQIVVKKLDSIQAMLNKMELQLSKMAIDDMQSKMNLNFLLRYFFHPSCDEVQQLQPHAAKFPVAADKAAHGIENIATIQPPNFVPIKVKCESGWTVILNRESGRTNFARNYSEYETGFGDPQEEYYIGNLALYHLTNWKAHQLRAEMEDFSGNSAFASYSTFRVGPPESFYQLTVGRMDPKSTAKDGLAIHNGMIFTTLDKDGDKKKGGNCASLLGGGGGWWYNDCYHVLGTGLYRKSQGNEFGGIAWWPWHNVKHSLKKFKLLIKPFLG